jgi:hypothetical protein
MPWLLLVVAGLMEVAWASLLPATNGLTRPAPTLGFGANESAGSRPDSDAGRNAAASPAGNCATHRAADGAADNGSANRSALSRSLGDRRRGHDR